MYELVNQDTGEVVAVYKTLREAQEHHARFPSDRIRRAMSEPPDEIGSAGTGGVTLAQMAENIKHGLDPYTGDVPPAETATTSRKRNK